MFTLNCKGVLVALDQPLVMGILNRTPDSFYPGSRLQGMDAVLQRAEQMLQEGAGMVDIGGQSTRPGSERITIAEELQRVIPPIEQIHRRFPETDHLDRHLPGRSRPQGRGGRSLSCQ